MDRRLDFQKLLESILGSKNVYFQPPPTLQMRYPAIKYSRSDIENLYADNDHYLNRTAYQVIVLDQNPDSEVIGKLLQLKYCKFNRHYTSDDLNHDVFTIYY